MGRKPGKAEPKKAKVTWTMDGPPCEFCKALTHRSGDQRKHRWWKCENGHKLYRKTG